MKKIILVGRSECGKTTLKQAMKGSVLEYDKTQYVNHLDVFIDTPGEYVQSKHLGHALAVYSYEADVVGLLASATEPYNLFPPAVSAMACRPVIGIITKIDHEDARTELVENWLLNAGVEKVFKVSSYEGDGIWELYEYLKEEGDVLPWESKEEANRPGKVHSDRNGEISRR